MIRLHMLGVGGKPGVVVVDGCMGEELLGREVTNEVAEVGLVVDGRAANQEQVVAS